jgi:Golgi phosphoprotein 3 (GPP34)
MHAANRVLKEFPCWGQLHAQAGAAAGGVMSGNYYRPAGGYGVAGPLESRLSGTGLVADDLWLLAHHEVTGRPYLHARQLGLGLAGGLLAELMTGPRQAIQIRRDGLLEIGPQVWPRTVNAHPLLRQMAAEPQLLPVRDWLLFLSRTAAGQVGERLEQAGYVIRSRRRLPGRPARLVPADRDWAFAPMTRATASVRRPSGPHGIVLAGLAVACGLAYRLDLYLTGAEPAVGSAVASLPGDMRQLIAQTRTAVSVAVLSHT